MKTKILLAAIIISSFLLHSNSLLACPSPIASFTYSPSAISTGDLITFDASSSSPPSGYNITKYEWDFHYNGTSFNPETTTTNAVTTNSYPTANPYTVALRVTNSANKQSTVFQLDITVTPYITVCGDITTNTTWTADKTYYVSCIVRVKNYKTLTIQPGTVVKFNNNNACLFAGIDGNLIAEGTPESYITFTSKYDCSVGETVDSSQQPQMADWGKIGIKKDSKISFCKISYANEGVMLSDFPCDITSVSIQHNIFNACGGGIGIYVLAGTGTTLNIFNNLVSNCGSGIAYYADNETAHLNIVNNTVVDCIYDGLFIYSASEAVNVYNNLISGCNTGIEGGLEDPQCKYNAFFNTATEFVRVDTDNQGTATNVYPTVSPFDSCVLGPYYLNSEPTGGALLIDAGYDPANQGMLGFTTQCSKLTDEAPVDIGFHYPSDYKGDGGGGGGVGYVICGPTIVNATSAISGGHTHSLFIKSDSTVWACGTSWLGALGLGDTERGPVTPELLSLESIVFVDAGNVHSLAVDSSGHVWAWGTNSEGQIGVTGDLCIGHDCPGFNLTRHWEPVEVRDTSGTGYLSNIKKVSVGIGVGDDYGFGYTTDFAEYSLALDNDGYVWAWGRNDYSPCDVSDPGCVPGYGQLGIGSTDSYRITPVMVPSIEEIVDIGAAVTHSIACDKNGNVWTWGCNVHGALGDGMVSGDYSTVPVKVLCGEMETETGFLENIVNVAVSGTKPPVDGSTNTSYALDSNGNVWAWGYGYFGQLGDNGESRWSAYSENCLEKWHSTTPIKVRGGEMGTPYLENIVAISAGNTHVLALDKFGRVWAWGANDSGQIGNGGVVDSVYCPCLGVDWPVTNNGVMAPDRVHKYRYDYDIYDFIDDGPLTDIVAIDAGGEHSMAIDRSGVVWVWGNDDSGQLGLVGDYPSPALMAMPMTSWSFCH